MIGAYKLNEDCRFRCGISSFGLSAGASVQVKQVDKEYSKVLIDFGGRDIDWFHNSILSKFTKENQQ